MSLFSEASSICTHRHHNSLNPASCNISSEPLSNLSPLLQFSQFPHHTIPLHLDLYAISNYIEGTSLQILFPSLFPSCCPLISTRNPNNLLPFSSKKWPVNLPILWIFPSIKNEPIIKVENFIRWQIGNVGNQMLRYRNGQSQRLVTHPFPQRNDRTHRDRNEICPS